MGQLIDDYVNRTLNSLYIKVKKSFEVKKSKYEVKCNKKCKQE